MCCMPRVRCTVAYTAFFSAKLTLGLHRDDRLMRRWTHSRPGSEGEEKAHQASLRESAAAARLHNIAALRLNCPSDDNRK